MKKILPEKMTVTSGVEGLDRLLGGGIIIGDNVVWYDDAGSLASVFCLNLMQASYQQDKSVIYISFDRSPKNLLEKLGPQADNRHLTILDCFTHGKGEGSDVFLDFYQNPIDNVSCQLIKVDQPQNADHVMGAFYGLHKTMKGDVRFIFESLTGMQELWGAENQILKFYSHSCPRLYELNTIAYWIVEKDAHTPKLKAHLNKITQVAIDLSLKRGKTALSILKAEKRDISVFNKPSTYWNKGLTVQFESRYAPSGQLDIGTRLKHLRTKKGLSQTELSKYVGVTPSTISQVENNQIYPSLPALIKMAEILNVDLSMFFKNNAAGEMQTVFRESAAPIIYLPHLPKESVSIKQLTPDNFESKAEHFLIEIPPLSKISSHFFSHKKEETGYLISGELIVTLDTNLQTIYPGDMICIISDMPKQWENQCDETARMFWVTIK